MQSITLTLSPDGTAAEPRARQSRPLEFSATDIDRLIHDLAAVAREDDADSSGRAARPIRPGCIRATTCSGA